MSSSCTSGSFCSTDTLTNYSLDNWSGMDSIPVLLMRRPEFLEDDFPAFVYPIESSGKDFVWNIFDPDLPALEPEDGDEPEVEKDHEPEDGSESPASTSNPKKGNNPFGSRGCAACAACRRRKGKVFPPCDSELMKQCMFKVAGDICEFCKKMSNSCGPKLSKSEFSLIQSGKPCPPVRCSDVAKEMERSNPDSDYQQIYLLVGERLKEMETKRRQVELGNIPA
jgi:hypothetical protein